MTYYPDTFIRGLSAEDWVADGLVTGAAFQIKFEGPFLRNGCVAHSIGWEDDESVVGVMIRQRKDDRLQFRAGLARVHRESVDRIMKLPAFRGVLSYDREPLVGNLYHGNLLVSPDSNKTQRKLLPGLIAAHAEVIALVEESQS